MLRPEQMSKVSVTGSRAVREDVIEAVHELNRVHLRDYQGDWSGFQPGDPDPGAEDASDRLVTVRSLESILGVTEDDAGPTRIVTDDAIEEQLETIRTEVNELDDRRNSLRDDLRSVEDRIEGVEPFADLGIDLELLSGYDSLEVAVGEGDPDDVESAIAHADDVRAYEVFSGAETVAAFVYPTEDRTDVLEDALVGVEFTRIEVPEVDGTPEEYLGELRAEKRSIESDLETVENELETMRLEHAGFLLAAEEKLSIEVEKREAPLRFATTEHAFVAEGWVPSEEYTTLVEGVQSAVGDRAEVQELERATYTPSHGHSRETVEGDAGAGGQPAATDGGTKTHDYGDDKPPVIQDNPGPAKPFELLTQVISRPKYTELDPTVILLLTFPAFYGFMIGDLGYGILYAGIGYVLWTRFDSGAFQALGGVAMWAGAFTALFGILYGEIFGLHLITQYFWQGALGWANPPMEKGLHALAYARLWLTLSVIVGVVHVGLGYVFGLVNDAKAHGLTEGFLENGSWLVLMVSLWVWIFSFEAAGSKPGFLVGDESVFSGNPVALGFEGFPVMDLFVLPIPGVDWALTVTVPLLGILLGAVLVGVGEGAVGLVELPDAMVNVISYTRIAAVLLAKAGMAFVVNLLVFGAYETGHGGETVTHFMLTHSAPPEATILFPGLMNAGIVGVVAGLVVLLAGHFVVLVLGVTSAGLQAVRLEYVEFFNKFYDGGGEKYEPFGHRRKYTTED